MRHAIASRADAVASPVGSEGCERSQQHKRTAVPVCMCAVGRSGERGLLRILMLPRCLQMSGPAQAVARRRPRTLAYGHTVAQTQRPLPSLLSPV